MGSAGTGLNLVGWGCSFMLVFVGRGWDSERHRTSSLAGLAQAAALADALATAH